MRELGHGDLMLILLVTEARSKAHAHPVVALVTLDSNTAGLMSRHTEWQSSGRNRNDQLATAGHKPVKED